jgi:hypothetical protein
MKCPRCEGLMYLERFSDYFLTFDAWKCINCGAVMDRIILLNQQKSVLLSEFAEFEPLPTKGRNN